MLIEFKCSNFRSIREEQTFSLVAKNTDKDLINCIIDKELPGLSKLKYLKGAAIYGANASGKSNVVAAIKFVSDFVKHSATRMNQGDKIGVEPFKLDKESILKPSKFEITFVTGDVRYLFGFSATTERVVEEYLVAYPKGIAQRWYQRTYLNNSQKFEWSKPSSYFKLDKNLQDMTRDNSLFLSIGSQFNHPDLTKVYSWFKSELKILALTAETFFPPLFTMEQFSHENYDSRLMSLLKSADIGVAKANIGEKDISDEEMRKIFPPMFIASMEKKGEIKQRRIVEVSLFHKAEGIDDVLLDFQKEESAGTRRFFALIGHWIDILENGYTVFIDEIETSLHPLLVKELLKLLFCDKNNPKGAQIVFTTHNPILLDGALIRRDQVWFTEKAPSGATHLYPLTDYQPRSGEAIAKGYIAGRYGAIPFIPDGLKLE